MSAGLGILTPYPRHIITAGFLTVHIGHNVKLRKVAVAVIMFTSAANKIVAFFTRRSYGTRTPLNLFSTDQTSRWDDGWVARPIGTSGW